MIRKHTLLVAVMAAILALTGCGSDEPQNDIRTAPNGDEFSDADVAFATDMIQHHAQALQMVDMTVGRTLDPEVQQLTDDIRAAQGPEIELMAGWLTDWDMPVPETVRVDANAGGHGDMEMDSDMPGMMTEEQMSELEAAQGDVFRDMWLEMMIMHHQGAVEMAKLIDGRSDRAELKQLGQNIIKEQTKEIAQMKDWQKAWFKK